MWKKKEWIVDWIKGLATPPTGGEPLAIWWDDMRSSEVFEQIKEAYDRGLRDGEEKYNELCSRINHDDPMDDQT